MTIRAARRLSLAVLVAASAWTCASQAAIAPDDLRRAAERAVTAHAAASGGRAVAHADKLDSRLQLADCPRGIQAEVPATARLSARLAVDVSCPGSWHVHVPVRLQLYRNVLVLVHPLQRGDGITAADVRSEERDVTRLGYGYIDSLDEVAERSASRMLQTGTVLTPAALGGRQAVRAGDHVQMIARLSGIEVRVTGTALGSGDTGARLKVRNDSSGKPVNAIVRDAGLVEALP